MLGRVGCRDAEEATFALAISGSGIDIMDLATGPDRRKASWLTTVTAFGEWR